MLDDLDIIVDKAYGGKTEGHQKPRPEFCFQAAGHDTPLAQYISAHDLIGDHHKRERRDRRDNEHDAAHGRGTLLFLMRLRGKSGYLLAEFQFPEPGDYHFSRNGCQYECK